MIPWALGLGSLMADFQGPAGLRPQIAAHRGASLLWPENSLTAFRGSLTLGVDAIECDVHLSRDDHLVVIHDPTLDRTTTGSGVVADRNWAEIRSTRLRSGPGAEAIPEPPPSLDELLALVAGRATLLIEIKRPRGGSYPGIEEEVLRAVEDRGLGDRVLVMSFDPETLRRMRRLEASIRLGGLVSRNSLRREGKGLEDAIAQLKTLGATFLGLEAALVIADAVAAAHRAGLQVGAWTVNDADTLARFAALGVDLLITDRPDLAKQVVK